MNTTKKRSKLILLALALLLVFSTSILSVGILNANSPNFVSAAEEGDVSIQTKIVGDATDRLKKGDTVKVAYSIATGSNTKGISGLTLTLLAPTYTTTGTDKKPVFSITNVERATNAFGGEGEMTYNPGSYDSLSYTVLWDNVDISGANNTYEGDVFIVTYEVMLGTFGQDGQVLGVNVAQDNSHFARIVGGNVEQKAVTFDEAGSDAVLLYNDTSLTIDNNQSKEYDGNQIKIGNLGDADGAVNADIKFFYDGNTSDVAIKYYDITNSTEGVLLTEAPTKPGEYRIELSAEEVLSAEFAYYAVSATATFSITKLYVFDDTTDKASVIQKITDELTNFYGDLNKVYTGNAFVLDISSFAWKSASAQNFDVTAVATNSNTDAGTYKINVTFTARENYTFTTEDAEVSFDIDFTISQATNKWIINLAVAKTDVTYGELFNITTPTAQFGEVVMEYTSSDNASIVTLELMKNAGYYAVSASVAGNDNYTGLSTAEIELSVAKKALTVSAEWKTQVYGDVFTGIKMTVTGGYAFNETIEDLKLAIKIPVELSPDNNIMDTPGKYSMTPISTNTNYEFTFVDGELEITKRPISIALKNKDVTGIYGDILAESFSSEYYEAINGTSLAYGHSFDLFTIILDYLQNGVENKNQYRDVGVYDIELHPSLAEVGRYNELYDVTFIHDSVQRIIPRRILVDTLTHGAEFNNTEPKVDQSQFNASLSPDSGSNNSLVNPGGTSFGITITKAPGVNVGKYPMTATTSSDNFIIVGPITENGDFEITKATYDITGIKFENASVTYDGTGKSLTATGLPVGADGIPVTARYSPTSKIDIGIYTFEARFTGSDNYWEIFAVKTAQLTILPDTTDKTITVVAKKKTYNGLVQSWIPSEFEIWIKVGADKTPTLIDKSVASVKSLEYMGTGSIQNAGMYEFTAVLQGKYNGIDINGGYQVFAEIGKGVNEWTTELVATSANNWQYFATIVTNAVAKYGTPVIEYSKDGINWTTECAELGIGAITVRARVPAGDNNWDNEIISTQEITIIPSTVSIRLAPGAGSVYGEPFNKPILEITGAFNPAHEAALNVQFALKHQQTDVAFSPTSGVGDYSVILTGTNDERYNITYVRGGYQVTKRPVNINHTGKVQEFRYTGSVPTLDNTQYTIAPTDGGANGLLAGDTLQYPITFDYDAVLGSKVNAGTYSVYMNGNEENYKLVFPTEENGYLVIKKAFIFGSDMTLDELKAHMKANYSDYVSAVTKPYTGSVIQWTTDDLTILNDTKISIVSVYHLTGPNWVTAGKYDIRLTFASSDANYTFSDTVATFDGEIPVEITKVEGNSWTKAPNSPNSDYKGALNHTATPKEGSVTIKYSIDDGATFHTFDELKNTKGFLDAGSYKARFTAVSANYADLAGDTTFTINRIYNTLSFSTVASDSLIGSTGSGTSTQSVIYNGKYHTISGILADDEQTIEYSIDNGTYGETMDVIFNGLVVKAYKITMTYAESKNYLANSADAWLTIKPKEIDHVQNASTSNYGEDTILSYNETTVNEQICVNVKTGEKDVLGYNFFLEDKDGNSSEHIQDKLINAGVYKIIHAFENSNYVLKNEVYANHTVNTIHYDYTGITFAGETFVFDNTNKSIFITGELPVGLDGSSPTVAYIGNAKNAVGTHTVTVTFVSSSLNYKNGDAMTADIIITKGENSWVVTITCAGTTYPNVLAPSAESKWGVPTYTYATTEGGVYSATAPTNAGTYWIKAVVAETDNYNELVGTAVSATIAKGTYTKDWTFGDFNFTYNSAEQNFAITGTLPEGVSVTYFAMNGTTETQDFYPTNVGTYVVYAKYTVTNANYNDIADDTASLIMAKLKLTYSIHHIKSLYGNVIKELTMEFTTGTNYNLTFNLTTTATDMSNVGVYDIDCAITGEQANYDIVVADAGSYTIEKTTGAITRFEVKGITYRQDPNVFTTANFGEVTLTYSQDGTTWYTLAEIKANTVIFPNGCLNAGPTVWVKATLVGTENFTGHEKTTGFAIAKAQLKEVEIFLENGVFSWSPATETTLGYKVEEGILVYKINGTNVISEKFYNATASDKDKVVTLQCSTTDTNNYTDSTVQQSTVVREIKFNSIYGTAPNAQYIFSGCFGIKPTMPDTDLLAFTGWVHSGGGMTAYNFDTTVQANLSLDSAWSTRLYFIYYMFKGTDGEWKQITFTAGSQYFSRNVYRTGEVTQIHDAEPFVNQGYIFDGWYTAADYTTKKTSISATEYGDIYLYSKWSADSNWIIYYTSDNGKDFVIGFEQEEFTGAVITLPDPLADKKFVRFECWYYDRELTQKVPAGATMDIYAMELYGSYVLNVGLGDVNGDGLVNADDVTVYRQFIVGGYDITFVRSGEEYAYDDIGGTVFMQAAADVNKDRKTGIADVVAIRMAIVGGFSYEIGSGIANVGTAGESIILKSFEITYETMTDGTVTGVASAKEGQTVTLTVTPNEGFELKAGTLKANGVAVVGNTFVMPNGVVSITAEFEAVVAPLNVMSEEFESNTNEENSDLADDEVNGLPFATKSSKSAPVILKETN